MSIKDDFQPYVDGNNLLAPGPMGPSPGRGSDNGTMYTSEYFIMLKKLGLLSPADELDYHARMSGCVDSNGMLNRAPVPTDSDQEGPDDYYGVLNGCMELGITDLPRKFLWALISHFGFLNNNQPGKMTGSSFLFRQLQLVATMIAASFPSLKNPLHYLARLLGLPFFVYSAICLLVSCINTDVSNTDARRLAWHMGNCNSKVSILNWLAYKVWLRRLKKDYANQMKDVAAIYYHPQGLNANPYSLWWVT